MTGVQTLAQYSQGGSDAGGQIAAAGQGASGPTTGQLISGAFGTVSSLAHVAGGFAEAASLRTQANYLGYEAKAAEMEGRRQALLELEDFNRSQARRVAAIGSSGIGYEGSPITGLEGAETESAENINLIKANTRVRVAGIKAQQKQTKKAAKFAIISGFGKMISQDIENAQKMMGSFF